MHNFLQRLFNIMPRATRGGFESGWVEKPFRPCVRPSVRTPNPSVVLHISREMKKIGSLISFSSFRVKWNHFTRNDGNGCIGRFFGALVGSSSFRVQWMFTSREMKEMDAIAEFPSFRVTSASTYLRYGQNRKARFPNSKRARRKTRSRCENGKARFQISNFKRSASKHLK